MKDLSKTVLLMDDETETADIVRLAIQRLRQEGFDVVTVERMSEAMNEFYRRYRRVYVLDIDMSRVEDVQEGDGGDVGRFLKGLDRSCPVVIFSARGEVRHWFASANFQVAAYIHKNDEDAIGRLVEAVRQASADPQEPSDPIEPVPPPRRALIVVEGASMQFSSARLETMVRGALEGWDVEVASDLRDAAARVERVGGEFGAIVAIADRFDTRPGTLAAVQSLCERRGGPHAVLGCVGDEGARPAILALVNMRPFRLIEIGAEGADVRLAEAVRQAARLYGRREILIARPDDLRRLQLEVPDDVLAAMGHGQQQDLEDEEGSAGPGEKEA